MELISNNNFIFLTEVANDSLVLIPVDNISIVAIDNDNIRATGKYDDNRTTVIFLKGDAKIKIFVKETIKEVYALIKGEQE